MQSTLGFLLLLLAITASAFRPAISGHRLGPDDDERGRGSERVAREGERRRRDADVDTPADPVDDVAEAPADGQDETGERHAVQAATPAAVTGKVPRTTPYVQPYYSPYMTYSIHVKGAYHSFQVRFFAGTTMLGSYRSSYQYYVQDDYVHGSLLAKGISSSKEAFALRARNTLISDSIRMFKKRPDFADKLYRVVTCHVGPVAKKYHGQVTSTAMWATQWDFTFNRAYEERESPDSVFRRACASYAHALEPFRYLAGDQSREQAEMSGDALPAADGKVLLTCTASGFYPYANRMYITTEGHESSQLAAYWGAVPRDIFASGVFRRTAVAYVDRELIGKTTCVFMHDASAGGAPQIYNGWDEDTVSLCERAKNRSDRFSTKTLKDFALSGDIRLMPCGRAIQWGPEMYNNEEGFINWPTEKYAHADPLAGK